MQHVSFDALSDSVQDFLARVWEAEGAVVEDEEGEPYYRVVRCDDPAAGMESGMRVQRRQRSRSREANSKTMRQAG